MPVTTKGGGFDRSCKYLRRDRNADGEILRCTEFDEPLTPEQLTVHQKFCTLTRFT